MTAIAAIPVGVKSRAMPRTPRRQSTAAATTATSTPEWAKSTKEGVSGPNRSAAWIASGQPIWL